jgi:CRISPR/Cas system CSM-associated protein Csm3 (group 7 of RAMP superfamily)
MRKVQAELRVRMLSEWGIMTGESAGFGADNTIVRDASGLPFIPGHSLRGLLRDAMSTLIDQSTIHKVFGRAGENAESAEQGLLSISNGEFVQTVELQATGLTLKEIGEALSLVRAQTRIDPNTGGVAHGSLRSIEVAAPGLEFRAEVIAPEEYFKDLQRAALLVRRLGHSRSRGYGYCEMALLPKHGAQESFETLRKQAMEVSA